MLPVWDPDRLVRKIPFNLGLVGGRKQGKSTAVSHLCQLMRKKFDLVIAFIGSASCNPVLKQQMEENWDSRFFFSEWDLVLMDRLMKQQEDLKSRGIDRNVLVLMDDVILNSKAVDQICHLSMRGRHFNISLMIAAVSYTTLPKRMRRSLDVLCVFSCPMHGDMKILTWEFAQQTRMAEFALKNLEEHSCLVLETLQKNQKLFVWKSDLLTLESETSRSQESEKLKTQPADGFVSECQKIPHQIENDVSSDRIQSEEHPTSPLVSDKTQAALVSAE